VWLILLFFKYTILILIVSQYNMIILRVFNNILKQYLLVVSSGAKTSSLFQTIMLA